MRIREARGHYLEWLKAEGLSSTSINQKKCVLVHFEDFLRTKGIDGVGAVTREVAEEYRSRIVFSVLPITGERRRFKTVRVYLGMVKEFLGYAVERGWLSPHPAAHILKEIPGF